MAEPSVLDKIRKEVAKLSPDDVKAQLQKLKEQKAKQVEYRKSRQAGPLSEEQKAKRSEYNKARMQRPEVKEKMKEYRNRPEVKDKMKQYRKERYERQKALLARAKELGLLKEGEAKQ